MAGKAQMPRLAFYLQSIYLVSERKLTKTVISSKARNLIVLKIQALKISPYGRNDKKRGFRSGTT